jgi:hypothetical protein
MIRDEDDLEPGDLVFIRATSQGTRPAANVKSVAVWLNFDVGSASGRAQQLPVGTFGIILHDENNFPITPFVRVLFTNGVSAYIHACYLELVKRSCKVSL